MKTTSATLLAAVLLFAGSAPVRAQRAEFGPRVGVTFSTVHVDHDGADNTDEGNITGFAAGAFLRFRPAGIGLQAELLYVRKGTTVVDQQGGDDSFEFGLGYVELPVLLVVPVISATPASAFVYGGPAVAFEANCSGKLTGGATSTSFDCGDPQLDFFDRRQTDVSGVFGAGARVAAGRGSITVDARYTFGFVNLNEENGDKITNRSAGIFVGYALRLGN